MDHAELERIGKETAEKIIGQYRASKTIEHGLAQSIGEERAAVVVYAKRASQAALQGDIDTALAYNHIIEEERQHIEEFNGRLIQKGGPIIFKEKSGGGWSIKQDRQGNIHFSHTGGPESFLQSESDKDLIFDILNKDEKNELGKGWNVSVKDSEPRSSILSEIQREPDSLSSILDEDLLAFQEHMREKRNDEILFKEEGGGRWRIWVDQLGKFYIGHTGRPNIFIKAESDLNLIEDILGANEKDKLESRLVVSIPDSQRRALVLEEIEKRSEVHLPYAPQKPRVPLTYGELRSFVNEFIDDRKFMGGIPKDKEAATILYREANGGIGMAATRIGNLGTVNFPDPPFGAKIIATIHTHPSGDIEFSPMDYVVAWNNNLEGQCVISPEGKRHCELLNFRLLSEADKEAAGQAIIIGLSPHVEDREGKYRKVSEMLKKAVVSRD
jgi:hypothetical protein